METADRAISKWTAVLALITVCTHILTNIHGHFPAEDTGLQHNLIIIRTLLLFLSSMTWLSLVAWEHRADLQKTGLIGYILTMVCFMVTLYWTHISGYTNLQSTFALWNASALFIGTFGILYFGTTLLTIGRYPKAAVVLWMAGMLMSVTGLGFMWAFRYYLISAGMIWCAIDFFSGNQSKRLGAQSTLKKSTVKSNRFLSLDMTRGLIMMLMAIDHTSMAVTGKHSTEIFNMPVPNYMGETASFLTRFITHFCAPGFFFLMGAGIILYAHSRLKLNWTQGKIISTLAIRGILLIAIERILWNPIIFGSLAITNGGVLFGLGGSLVFAALFIRLNSIVLFIMGITGVLVTQVLPQLVIDAGIFSNPLSGLFLLPKTGRVWFNLYPIFPWLCIVLIGMAFGKEILKNKEKAFQKLLYAGLISLTVFVIVRFTGGFGNLKDPAGSGLVDFFNVNKYPPALVFTSLTLGVISIVLYLFERFEHKFMMVKKPLLVFGQTALFFYFIHWYYFMGLSSPFYIHRGNLIWVYAMWILGLIFIYPLCKRYLNFKQNTALGSIWRFF